MPSVSAGDKTLLRAAGHRSNFLLLVHRPATTWAARINDGAIGQGETSIAFDAGAGSDFSLIEEVQEVLVGSTSGGDEIGRLRVRSVSSGDGGVTGTLTVAENNLYMSDNNYLTFKIDYPIKPVYPKIDSGGIFYKDRTTTYGSNYNDQPNPVVVAGGHRAERIDSGLGYAQFNVDASASYAVANGATISSYSLSVIASSGYTTSFNTGTGTGYVRFTAAGQYWVKYGVTDSNGKTQSSRRLYFVIPNDITNANYGYDRFSVESLSGDWSAGGWQGQFQLYDDADITEIPERTIVMLWRESWFGSTQKNITFDDDDNGATLVGYATNSSVAQDFETGLGTYTLGVVTAQEILNQYQFSVSLEAISASPTKWYEYASWLTVGRIIHHILKWHSTVLECTDMIGLTDNTDGRAFGDIVAGTVYSMCDNLAFNAGIRARLVCDQMGRLHLTMDPQLLPDTPRGALTTTMDIVIDDDISGGINIQDAIRGQVAMAKVSGLYFDGTFASGLPNVVAYCAIAPGTVPHDIYGATVATLDRQVVTSQSHANQLAGRLFATKNNPHPTISFDLHGNYAGVMDPAYGEEFTMDLQASQNERGIVWGNKPMYLRHVELRIDVSAGSVRTSVTFEPEAESFTGITTDCLGLPTIGGATPPPPAASTLPGALVSAASVNYLTPQSKTWTQLTAEATTDMIADPFWRTRQGTTASASAILLRCGNGFIKRSTDGGTNWSTITPSGSPTNSANDTSPPTFAGLNYVALAPDWSTQGTFYALGRWQNGGNLWRSWLIKTTNDGTSWSNIQLGVDNTAAIIDQSSFGSGGGTTVAAQSGIAVLDSTNFIGINNDNHAEWYSVDGSYAITDRDDVITFNTRAFSITPVSSTRAIVTYRRADVGNVGYGGTLVLDTSTGPDTLTQTQTNNFISTNTVIESRVVAVSSTKLLVVYRMASPATDELFMAHGTISGTTVSWAAGTSIAAIAGFDLGLVYMGTNDAILTYSYDDGSGTDIYARHIDTSGVTPSAGAATEIVNGGSFAIDSVEFGYPSPDNLLAQYNSTTCIRAFEYSGDQVGIVAFTYSGTSINGVGTPIDIGGGSASNEINRPSVCVQGTTIVVCFGNHTSFRAQVTTATVSGTTLTASGTVTTLPIGDGTSPHWPALANLDGTALVGAFSEFTLTSVDDTLRVATINLSGTSYAAKARGVDVSRVAGGSVYVTSLINEVRLAFMKHTASTLALSSHGSLGSSTLAQFDARTYDAVPVCSFTDDNHLWVYGRMQGPQGLANPSHIIRSLNAGGSWTAIESGWGTDVCGALEIPAGGILVAFRANATNSKLYMGTTTLALIQTIPTGKTINPHAIALDYFNGAIFAGAGAASSIMVVGALPPYLVWKDFTYTHQTANAVTALVLL